MWASKGYTGGNAHSVIEFYNPALPGWQVVAALTATVVRDRVTGRPVSMAELLRRKRIEGLEGIWFDQSRWMELLKVPGLNTRQLLARNRTPHLNLIPSSFLPRPRSDIF